MVGPNNRARAVPEASGPEAVGRRDRDVHWKLFAIACTHRSDSIGMYSNLYSFLAGVPRGTGTASVLGLAVGRLIVVRRREEGRQAWPGLDLLLLMNRSSCRAERFRNPLAVTAGPPCAPPAPATPEPSLRVAH